MYGPDVEPSHELALAGIASEITVLENEVGLIEPEDAPSTVGWIDELAERLAKCRERAVERGEGFEVDAWIDARSGL